MHASYNVNDYVVHIVVHITEQRTLLEYAMGWKQRQWRCGAQ